MTQAEQEVENLKTGTFPGSCRGRQTDMGAKIITLRSAETPGKWVPFAAKQDFIHRCVPSEKEPPPAPGPRGAQRTVFAPDVPLHGAHRRSAAHGEVDAHRCYRHDHEAAAQ